MAANRREGRAITPILVLLLLLIGAGAYNYQRNWEAEKSDQGPRPFETYSVEDLTQLRAAYAEEIRQFEQRYASQRERRVRASGEGLVGERLEEFERIQHTSSKLREIGAEVAERQARLREIEQEIAYRAALDSGLELHIKRLTSI